MSIDAGSPDSLRKPCRPPSGTNVKSPGFAVTQSLPSWIRTLPDSTKNDSVIVRWKWASAPPGFGPMSQR